MGTAGTHAKVRYRCFLPDLAGFTSPRCPDHKLLLQSSLQRRGWDSNPRYPFRVYTLSRRAPSATRPPLQDSRAESVGFEPTVPLPVRLISSQVPSTTRPALQDAIQFSAFLRSADRRKKSFRASAALGLPARPLVTSTPVIVPRRLGQVVQRSHRARPSGPARRTPAASTRACTSAPAHIAQGSRVTYSVTPVSRQAPERPCAASAQREHLGVGEGIAVDLAAVEAAADDRARRAPRRRPPAPRRARAASSRQLERLRA